MVNRNQTNQAKNNWMSWWIHPINLPCQQLIRFKVFTPYIDSRPVSEFESGVTFVEVVGEAVKFVWLFIITSVFAVKHEQLLLRDPMETKRYMIDASRGETLTTTYHVFTFNPRSDLICSCWEL